MTQEKAQGIMLELLAPYRAEPNVTSRGFKSREAPEYLISDISRLFRRYIVDVVRPPGGVACSTRSLSSRMNERSPPASVDSVKSSHPPSGA